MCPKIPSLPHFTDFYNSLFVFSFTFDWNMMEPTVSTDAVDRNAMGFEDVYVLRVTLLEIRLCL